MPDATLIDHNATQFARSVMTLSSGVWGAVGFAASNAYMVEGRDSVTIIDTTESTEAASHVLVEFRQLCAKPVARIIYTHSHRDHISGATVFAADQNVSVVASKAFSSDLVDFDPDAIAPSRALGRRTQAQFGIGLTEEERISLGCGPGNRPMGGLGQGFLPPTIHIAKDQEIDLDGVKARLIMAPGETADHMLVWLPEQRVLFGGDNWYHAFPNLYAIRGTPYRDFAAWAGSLRMMSDLGAQILAPGHTLPVSGAEKVVEVLNSTRCAILFVMRETASMMDQGYSLDDIAASITLPAELAGKPWLGEFYGKLSWSARAFATGTLGWYDGNPTHLGTLATHQRAQHMAALAGSNEALMRAATDTPDLQWKLELCDFLIALEQPARQLKSDTLLALAEMEVNATARNTYIWEAKYLSDHANGTQ